MALLQYSRQHDLVILMMRNPTIKITKCAISTLPNMVSSRTSKDLQPNKKSFTKNYITNSQTWSTTKHGLLICKGVKITAQVFSSYLEKNIRAMGYLRAYVMTQHTTSN